MCNSREHNLLFCLHASSPIRVPLNLISRTALHVMDEDGCFDVCVAEPDPIEVNSFKLWLQGLSPESAARRRVNEIFSVLRQSVHDKDEQSLRMSALTKSFAGLCVDESEVLRLVRASLADDFRLLDLLEGFLFHPPSFLGQPFVQLPRQERMLMLEVYYSLDPSVVRELLWRKPLGKRIGKDLEDVEGATGVSLRSCRRQFDNLRRIYTHLEDQRAFQCHVAVVVEGSFHISTVLACQYTVCSFLLFHRFVLSPPSYDHPQGQPHSHHHKASVAHPTSPKPSPVEPSSSLPPSPHLLPPSSSHGLEPTRALSFQDLEFMSLAILTFWVPDTSRTVMPDLGAKATEGQDSQRRSLPGACTPPLDLERRGSQTLLSLSQRLGRVGVAGRRRAGDILECGQAPVPRVGGARSVSEVAEVLSSIADVMVREDEEREHRGADEGLEECGKGKRETGTDCGSRDARDTPALPPRRTSWAASATCPPEGLHGRARGLLQCRLRCAYGMELEKELLVGLRELSRLFNDSTILDQYQAQVAIRLLQPVPEIGERALGRAIRRAGGQGDALEGGRARLRAVERRFRAILQPLSALGWGLSLHKELRDLFEDMLVKVTAPLRDLNLSRQDLCNLFSALISSFPCLPAFTGKSKGLPQRRIKQYAVSWARFLSGVLLCILHTYSTWHLPSSRS
ncbi:fibroblast growth factor intracellular binding protein [Nannochloropsis gaditana]|uniref:Fibroblast growth factor intracellular binding protein n=1 Tax=Nannochloropsis gaditana TaxID=72520 RepID=W7TMJ0_9STRA|nr:fibroblast growth factor intracellular binding protein [Nannochloropsis gaditana]